MNVNMNSYRDAIANQTLAKTLDGHAQKQHLTAEEHNRNSREHRASNIWS
jgi:hypothetical protein